jgi:hypothetical protein
MGWITLHEACTRLQQEYPALLAHQAFEITEGAVRSGLPFVRGEELGRNYPELIGDRIKIHEQVDVFNSVIRDWGYLVRWMHVEVQWEKFIAYVEENLLPAWISPNAAKRKQAKPQEKVSRRKRSRKRGPARNSVGYSKLDAEHFPAMERLIASGESRSAYAAALNLVRASKVRGSGTPENIKVRGSGTPENIAKRLARRFLKKRHRRSTR